MHTPFRFPQRQPVRQRLTLTMVMALVFGLLVLLFFHSFTSIEVQRILRKDLDQVSYLMGHMLREELDDLTQRTELLAETNALRILLDLELPAQARRYLQGQSGPGSPFSGMWLLDADGRTVAGLRTTETGAGPGAEPAAKGRGEPDEASCSRPPLAPSPQRQRGVRLLSCDGRLAAAVLAPVRLDQRPAGYLVTLTPFPKQALLDVPASEHGGLALLLGRELMAGSSWLNDTDFASLGPLHPGEVSLSSPTGRRTYLLQEYTPLPEFPEVRAQLLRDLEEAREPFRFLTVIFMACWLTLLIAFLVISRVFNRSLVRPVLHLADTAEFVSREKTLPPDFARDSSRHAGSEVAALHQAFFDMVTSLHQAMTRAEVADRTKSDFLSMVSHEIRTPLTSILGFTKIIDKEFKRRVLPVLDESGRDTGPARQRIRGNIDIILTEGGRLTELLNDVLDLAKLEAGRIDWRFEELSVADLADHTLRAMESLFQDKGLAWENRVQPDLPRVCGDRNRLTQVLVNLVSNAVKFTDSGLVAVEARLEAGMVLVSVSDTGPGIGADDVQAVFEKFRQGGDIDVNKPKGTGLGLPICKQIVEFHGGTIWVESEPGTGSTFCFTLPAHRVGDCLPPEEH